MTGQDTHGSTPGPLRFGWPLAIACGISGSLGGLLAPNVVAYFNLGPGAQYWLIGLVTALCLAALMPLAAVLQRR
jgi:hypothetical protein